MGHLRIVGVGVGVSFALVGVALTPANADAPAAPVTQRVSVSSDEKSANNMSGRYSRPAVSAHGDLVAFDSIATNLVPGDKNRSADVFVRDRATGTTTNISVSTSGEQANDDSARADLSGDGRYVAFDTAATNFADGDTNGTLDVYVHDRVTGTTTLVSQTAEAKPGNGGSFGPSISRNGKYVAFTSDATDLTKKQVTGARDVFIRNLVTGRTHVVSLSEAGTPGGVGANSPSVSPRGRYVAFASYGTSLVEGDTNDAFDVFVRDRKLATTTRVSVDSSGGQSDGGSYQPAISADGSRVAFASEATNLVADDTNGVQDIYVHDLATGQTTRASVGPDGVQGDGQSNGPGIRGGTTFGPDLSANGRYVTFDSIATNLVSDDTNTCDFGGGPSFTEPGQCPDIFVRDLEQDVTRRVSVATDGSESDGSSTDPAISSDGASIAFYSTATNFDAADKNTCQPFFGSPGQCPDIYVHDR